MSFLTGDIDLQIISLANLSNLSLSFVKLKYFHCEILSSSCFSHGEETFGYIPVLNIFPVTTAKVCKVQITCIVKLLSVPFVSKIYIPVLVITGLLNLFCQAEVCQHASRSTILAKNQLEPSPLFGPVGIISLGAFNYIYIYLLKPLPAPAEGLLASLTRLLAPLATPYHLDIFVHFWTFPGP